MRNDDDDDDELKQERKEKKTKQNLRIKKGSVSRQTRGCDGGKGDQTQNGYDKATRRSRGLRTDESQD